MSRYFHFTLGPVQGFVAQARRTRDFWAGSFLLSFLSAVAMKAAQKQEGEILFPRPQQGYLDWLENRGKGTSPRQGAVPNRFKARVPENFDPASVLESVRCAWQALAGQVWEKDVAAHAGDEQRCIWDRQIEGFWDMAWALSEDEGESDLLDRRKNWRSHYAPAEPGDKCQMMEGWQELSGIATPNATGQNQFWPNLRTGSMKTDLRDGERLCAIALVKRRFVRHFRDLNVGMPGGWTLHGWQLEPAVPSVAYMAAAPWLAAALDAAATDANVRRQLESFHDRVRNLDADYGEWSSDLKCVSEARKHLESSDKLRKTTFLDGNVFFQSALENTNLYPDQEQARQVIRAFSDLQTTLNTAPPSPFYAVLLMDGDSLGMHMSDLAKQGPISDALDRFTQGVPQRVAGHSGFLVYAGGDDVLALLPLESALGCALELQAFYRECFASTEIDSTLSGAVNFAHIKTPLSKILGDAHGLLDDVAKDATGRDAIAVRVWKPGGLALEWAMPWDGAREDGERLVLEALADNFRQREEKAQFSSKFLYRIRERFDLLHDSRGRLVLDRDQAVALLAAEYLGSGVNQGVAREDKLSMSEAEATIEPLFNQCRPRVRRDGAIHETGAVKADAAFLVRFLAHKGREEA